jgi:iron(III) transport system permease protein
VPVDAPTSRRPGALLVAVSLAVAGLFAAPSAYLVWRNTAFGSELVGFLTSAETLVPLGRSVALAASVSASAAAVGTFLAWCVVRTDVPGRRLWRVLAPLPLVIPSFVGATALLAALASGGLLARLLSGVGVERVPQLSGFWGAWLVLTAFTYPYVYLPVAARLAALPPSLEESARLLGCPPRRVFRTVVLPQARAAVWAGTLLVFLYTVSDFGAVELMRYGTLTREIFAKRLVPASSLPLALVLAGLAVAVVVLERRANRRSLVTGTVRNRDALRVPLGRWRWPAFGAVALVLLLGLVVPVGVLAYWAARGVAHAGSGSVELATDVGGLAGPAFNTLAVSLVAAVVAVVVVLPVAYLTTRYRSRVGGLANALVVGGFALPGLVVALALVFWSLGSGVLGPLYQTIPLLVFAYVVHFGAQAMRAGQVAVGAVPGRLHDAARILGARPARRLLTVDGPLMLPGLLAGGGLVLLSAMKELPATLLLAPPNFQTLATRLWSANESHYFAQVGLAGLALVGLSGALTWALVLRRQEVLG